MSETRAYNLWVLIFLAVLIAAAVLSWYFANSVQADGLLHVYFLDVGQGDSIFIETPHGNQILIDGGPDSSVVNELNDIMPFYDRSIDAVLLTHPEADHVTGLVDVLERYDVKNILSTQVACDTSICRAWEDAVSNEGADVYAVYKGYEIRADDNTYLRIMHPIDSIKGERVAKLNSTSLVIRLAYMGQSVLFTGDIEKPVEKRLPFFTDFLDSDFLKVGHHGSKTSSTEDFLKQVSPFAAFISVGEGNSYGHPHKIVTQRLEQFSIPYYRTDIDGRTELVLDGLNYKINTSRKQ